MARNFEFSKQLLNYIKTKENNEVISALNEDLIKASDNWGSLLHYAVLYDNIEIIPHLIVAGVNVNFMKTNTPLMLAVQHNKVAAVIMLLKVGANIHIGDVKGRSALREAFHKYGSFKCEIIEAFIKKLRAESKTTKELVDKLILSGLTFYYAVSLGDTEVMNYMLNHGFNVNSRGPMQRTALHVAVQLDDLRLVKWLLDRNADINAVDELSRGALQIAASRGNKMMLQFLLERGATRYKANNQIWSSLFPSSHSNTQVTKEQYDECAECLLQYGAIPIDFPIFDCALSGSYEKRLKMLTAHMAMLEELGTSISKYVMYCNKEENRSKMVIYENYYQSCQRVLEIIVYTNLPLIDLLHKNENEMRIIVRNETIMSKIMEVCSEQELEQLYPYYYNRLMKCISMGEQIVNLEEAAIIVISEILESTVNQCYDFGRKVVRYLNRCDLEQLCRVFE